MASVNIAWILIAFGIWKIFEILLGAFREIERIEQEENKKKIYMFNPHEK